MPLSSEQIKIDALSLPPEERTDLINRLLDSLGPADAETIEQEWLATARRRLEELTSGQVTGVDAGEVFARLRSRNMRT